MCFLVLLSARLQHNRLTKAKQLFPSIALRSSPMPDEHRLNKSERISLIKRASLYYVILFSASTTLSSSTRRLEWKMTRHSGRAGPSLLSHECLPFFCIQFVWRMPCKLFSLHISRTSCSGSFFIACNWVYRKPFARNPWTPLRAFLCGPRSIMTLSCSNKSH